MNFVFARKMMHVGKKFLINHSADILTAATVTGTIVTAIETHKATRKADEYLAANGYDQANPDTQKVLKFEAAKNYILPVAVGAGTIAAAIGANYINHKQIAGLAAACTVAETALNEYRDKIQDMMGDKAIAKIDDEIMADQGHKIMASSEIRAIDTGHGNRLCIEGITGQVVLASPEWFESCKNKFNQEVVQLGSAPVARYLEFLYEDCKEPYYIPEDKNYVGYGINVTGIMEFERPHWEGDANTDGYVVYKPLTLPVHNFMENY